MSVIQQIRDKAAWLVFGLIALSLIGFLAMDAFMGGRGRGMSSNSDIMGNVNGEDIPYPKFQALVDQMENQYKAQGYPVNDMMTQNIKNQVWEQFVQDGVMDKIYQKTGIDVSDKELNDMLVGPNAVPGIKQSFTDRKTGIFDAQAAASTINQLRTLYKSNKKTDNNYVNAKRLFEELIPQWIKDRQKDKYLAMLGNSAYVPKWMIEKTNSDQSQIAAISYVNTPYSTVADSTIKISDDEILDYIQKHKEQFKQDESRSIAYVAFNAAPTSGDTAAVLKQIADLKAEFDTTHNVETFLARNGSELALSDSYFPKSKIQVPKKDSIFALAKNAVFGPYLDGSDYVLAKKLDEKSLPDTVKCRHVLVSTNVQEGGFPDSIALQKIDSVKNAINSGAVWASMVEKYNPESDGSKQNKGEMTFSSSDIQAPNFAKEFAQFILFDGKTGEKKIIKTSFGYHYIEIMDQKNFEPAYKVAYMAKKIEPSNTTDQNASGLASQFAGESRTQSAFDENIKKNNYQKLIAGDILPTANTIQGLGTNRQLVKWIYDDKTSIGDVSEPYTVGDKYVVAIVTEINKEGTMTAAKARPLAEPFLRNQKKSEQIIKKIGTVTTLDAVAKATNQQVLKADSVMFAAAFIPNVGQELKVIGASFNKQLVGKPASEPIAGNGGVFVIKVENVSAKSNPIDIEVLRKNEEQQQRSVITYRALEALKKTAKIKDNRAKFL